MPPNSPHFWRLLWSSGSYKQNVVLLHSNAHMEQKDPDDNDPFKSRKTSSIQQTLSEARTIARGNSGSSLTGNSNNNNNNSSNNSNNARVESPKPIQRNKPSLLQPTRPYTPANVERSLFTESESYSSSRPASAVVPQVSSLDFSDTTTGIFDTSQTPFPSPASHKTQNNSEETTQVTLGSFRHSLTFQL